MTEAERFELADIGNGGNGNEEQTNALMNATYIGVDGAGVQMRYNVGIRNRGHGSRFGPPNNYHLDIAHDNPLGDLTAVNLNVRNVQSQLTGSAIFRCRATSTPRDIS